MIYQLIHIRRNLSLLAEVLGYMVPLLTSFASQLIGPLLDATNTEDQNHKLVNLLVSFGDNDEVLNNALVPAAKQVLANEPPPTLNTCFSWIIQGTSLTTGFYLAGLLDLVKKAYEDGEECRSRQS